MRFMVQLSLKVIVIYDFNMFIVQATGIYYLKRNLIDAYLGLYYCNKYHTRKLS